MTKQLDRETWRLVVLGYAVLSLAWLIGAGWTYKQERDIHHTLQGVRANQERIVRLTADTTALICALAENDEAGDKAIMEAYVSPEGGQFALAVEQLPPVCVKARRVARERIVGLQDGGG